MSFSKNAIIYSITCLPTGRVYIGQTSTQLSRRWRAHRNDLSAGKHRNRFLQAAWMKYGESAFEVKIREVVTVENSTCAEVRWVKELNTMAPAGFNFLDPATPCAGDARSYVVTAPTGIEYEITNLHKFCRENNLCSVNMTIVAQSKRADYKGWKCRYRGVSPDLMASRLESFLSQRRSDSKFYSGGYRLTRPDGSQFVVMKLGSLCRKECLDQGALIKVSAGLATHHHGWRAERLVA